MRLLVIGINIRHIAASASRAGHRVYAADGYCDRDLSRWAEETALLPRQGAEQAIPLFIERFSPDAVVLGSGLEEASVSGVPVLNNPPARTSQVSDKLWLANWLEKNGFPLIRTLSGEAVASALDSGGLTYPFLVKPRKGAGGVGCGIVKSPHDLPLTLPSPMPQDTANGIAEMIAQELVSGRPASVSVIGNGREARAIAVNEQLIGLSWAGGKGFRYCGNITPLEQCDNAGLASMAEEIVAGLGLVGSNGVDFMITEKGPRVLEVNCRFQGSLDPVEMATGGNVFSAHLQAFSGELPGPLVPPERTAGRTIVYPPGDLTVKADLCRDWSQDVPAMGSRIMADEPLLSITAQGRNRGQVLAMLQSRAGKMLRLAGCRSWDRGISAKIE